MSGPGGTNRLSGELFEGTADLNVDRLQRLFIEGRAEIANKLLLETDISDQGFSPFVTTTLRLNGNGEIVESYLDVSQEQHFRKQKVPATRIFPSCTPETKLLLNKLYLRVFNFPPSSNHSEWLNASSFGLSFQKKNNRDQGVYTSDEWAAQGVGDFALKLVVEATEEVGVSTARVVALPLPVERLGELPGGCAKDVHSYPVIDLFSRSFELQMLPQNYDPCRGDSLPVLPCSCSKDLRGTSPPCRTARRSSRPCTRCGAG